MSHRRMQSNYYAILTKNLHTILLSVQGLDHKLDLVGQDRARKNPLQEQIIELLESTRLVQASNAITRKQQNRFLQVGGVSATTIAFSNLHSHPRTGPLLSACHLS
jgi:hypothetical protein